MLKYKPSKQLQNLVLQLIDETIDSAGMQELESLFVNDQKARRWYIAQARIHGSLHRWAARTNLTREEDLNSRNAISITSLKQPENSRRYAYPAAAAIVIMAALLSVLYFTSITKDPLLAFTTSPNCQFTLSHTDPSLDQTNNLLYQGSELSLTSGSIELNFESGVRSILTAPATITLKHSELVELQKGKAWFHVPQQAVGFSVLTENLNIVDLGTDFGVIAESKNGDEIHVLQGAVEAQSQLKNSSPILLRKNQARGLDLSGDLIEIPVKPFQTTLPQTQDYLHWSFDHIDKWNFKADGNHPKLAKAIAESTLDTPRSHISSGKFGNAFSLNGQEQSQLITQHPGFDLSQATTIAYWVKFPQKITPDGSTTDAPILTWAMPDSTSRYERASFHMMQTDVTDQLGHRVSCSGYSQNNINLADGEWHHITTVITGKPLDNQLPEMRIYVDGKLTSIDHSRGDTVYSFTDKDGEYEGQNLVFGSPTTAGLSYGNSASNTLIDEVFILKGTLDEKQIIQLMETNQLP